MEKPGRKINQIVTESRDSYETIALLCSDIRFAADPCRLRARLLFRGSREQQPGGVLCGACFRRTLFRSIRGPSARLLLRGLCGQPGGVLCGACFRRTLFRSIRGPGARTLFRSIRGPGARSLLWGFCGQCGGIFRSAGRLL